jgi:hypothetical protein
LNFWFSSFTHCIKASLDLVMKPVGFIEFIGPAAVCALSGGQTCLVGDVDGMSHGVLASFGLSSFWWIE